MRSAANARGKSDLSDCDSVANARAKCDCGDCCGGGCCDCDCCGRLLQLLLLPLLVTAVAEMEVSNESSLAKVTNMHGSDAQGSMHESMRGSTITPPKLSLLFERGS